MTTVYYHRGWDELWLWYDVTGDNLMLFPFDLATMVMEAGAWTNCPPNIEKIETTKDFASGRLIANCGSILEFIGEL